MEVVPADDLARAAAERVDAALAPGSSVVLTGGATAAAVYPELARLRADWSGIEVLFSDERCVPPDDDRSNFGMVSRLLLGPASGARVHRMRGELDPPEAAADYGRAVAPAVAAGPRLCLLSLGPDCHVAGLFPGSPALRDDRLCVAVRRPDGLRGLTLTPRALLAARTILLLAAGPAKADALRRLLAGDEPVDRCPARLLTPHPEVTVLC